MPKIATRCPNEGVIGISLFDVTQLSKHPTGGLMAGVSYDSLRHDVDARGYRKP
jgi:hypothetical protein